MSKPVIDIAFIKRCAARSLESRGFLFADPHQQKLGHAALKSLPQDAQKLPVFQQGHMYYINPAYLLKLQDWQIETLFLDILNQKP